MLEEVRLRSVEVELWIRVVGVLMPMPILPSAPLVARRHEGTVSEQHWACRLNDLEAHYYVVRHTEPHRACAKPVFHAVAHVLQEVPANKTTQQSTSMLLFVGQHFSGFDAYFEA